MNSELLITVGQALYGERWQTNLARDLGLSDARRIRQWLSGERKIPDLEYELRDLLRDRLTLIETALSDLPMIFGTTLQECCEYLNSLEDEDMELVDLSSLPTFGGPDIENTSEVFSWDEARILVQSENGFEIQRACDQCGEATFHCDHSG